TVNSSCKSAFPKAHNTRLRPLLTGGPLMVRTAVAGLSVVMCALFLPGAAMAQQAAASGIAGVVKDASGAVLPGATVEAASPALIEKVRTVVTDGEGRYNIVD